MKIKNFFNNSFLLAGERLALVPIILIFGFILTFENVGKAKAQENFIRQNFNKDGLSVVVGSLENVEFETVVDNENVEVKKDTDVYNNLISVEVESVRVPTPTPKPVDVSSSGIWDTLAQCESGSNWSINTGNGYFGGLQFSQGAWNSVGGSGIPSDASREEQIERGKLLQSIRGWGAWGLCAKKLNLL